MAHDLARGLALEIDRGLALDRDRDLARAHARALTRALNSALVLDLDRDHDRIREILSIVEGLRDRLAGQAKAASILSFLDAARDRAQRALEAAASQRDVLNTWLALERAWSRVPASFEAWQALPRPVLNRGRLEELAAALDGGRPPALAALLPRLDGASLVYSSWDSAAAAVRGTLEGWLAEVGSGKAELARHAALLLAEMGVVAPGTIPGLCACLVDPVDLTRYRAQIALHRGHSATALGRETVEQMACCRRCASGEEAGAACPALAAGAICWRRAAAPDEAACLADTYLDWSLKAIEHDEPAWLAAWTEAGEAEILGRIHRLSKGAWPQFISLLAAARPAARKALLESTAWLLRLDRVPGQQLPILADHLLASLAAPDAGVRMTALEALGHLPRPTAAVADALLHFAPGSKGEPEEQGTACTALARLAARAGKDEGALGGRLEGALRGALPAKAAAAGLARLLVSRTPKGQGFDPAAALQGLRDALRLPSDKLLQAMLGAGTDDDGWSGYHERIALLVRRLVEDEGSLLPGLLAALRRALGAEAWPPKRMALVAVAACAEVMPDALNAALPREQLEGLLLAGAREAGSHHARRQAVTALGHLHTATPPAVQALLAASRDVASVQKDAIDAAGRFQHLSAGFAEEEALAALAEALTGESAAAAYAAARLLAALGSAPAAVEVQGLRGRIAGILSDALRGEGAGRDVYLLVESAWREPKIEHQGTLARALFDALVQVVGLPE